MNCPKVKSTYLLLAATLLAVGLGPKLEAVSFERPADRLVRSSNREFGVVIGEEGVGYVIDFNSDRVVWKFKTSPGRLDSYYVSNDGKFVIRKKWPYVNDLQGEEFKKVSVLGIFTSGKDEEIFLFRDVFEDLELEPVPDQPGFPVGKWYAWHDEGQSFDGETLTLKLRGKTVKIGAAGIHKGDK